MPNLGVPELLIIAVLVILLFGAKKLPDAARSLGRSMRIFKSEVKEMSNDDAATNLPPAPQQQTQLPQAQAQPTYQVQPQQTQQPQQ